MFNSCFSAFLRIVDAFIPFTVDRICRLFGITLAWRQRVLKWRWFFQQANFLVVFSSPRNVFTTSRSCCRMILEWIDDPVYWLLILITKKPDHLSIQGSPMYSYSAITNVLALVLSHHQCTRTHTQPSPMYSYSAITNVLVLSHHQCTRTHTQPSPMYSYSAITNVLVLILSHHQCTRTQPSPMYSYSAITNVLVLSHHQCTRTQPSPMYSHSYSAITNVLVLVISHHQCTRTHTQPSPMYSYSYSAITNVLVLSHHQCTRTHTQPSPMYSYSYSAITNVLVLSHHQCTRTHTQPSPMYSYSYSAITNVLVLVLSHHQCTRTRALLMEMFSAPGLIHILRKHIIALALTVLLMHCHWYYKSRQTRSRTSNCIAIDIVIFITWLNSIHSLPVYAGVRRSCDRPTAFCVQSSDTF